MPSGQKMHPAYREPQRETGVMTLPASLLFSPSSQCSPMASLPVGSCCSLCGLSSQGRSLRGSWKTLNANPAPGLTGTWGGGSQAQFLTLGICVGSNVLGPSCVTDRATRSTVTSYFYKCTHGRVCGHDLIGGQRIGLVYPQSLWSLFTIWARTLQSLSSFFHKLDIVRYFSQRCVRLHLVKVSSFCEISHGDKFYYDEHQIH